MLKVQDLSCGYGDEPVVKSVSFTAQPNEKICILGPNGCGKTTLLRGIAGLLPTDGYIDVSGLDMRQLNSRQAAAKLAYMSQISSVYFSYTVHETVMLGRYAHIKRGLFSSVSQSDKQIVLDAMEKTGTLDLKDRLITELSGGQLQRVFLARTFAQNPQIILLDEPTNHLDLKYQIELVKNLQEWVRQDSRCVIAVFHDINLAFSFADRIILMKDGHIMADERTEKFDISALNSVYGIDVSDYMRNILKRWEDIS